MELSTLLPLQQWVRRHFPYSLRTCWKSKHSRCKRTITQNIKVQPQGTFGKHVHPVHQENEYIPSSAARSGRWRWTFPAGSWRWWTGRPWPPCSHWHTSGQRPRSGPADTTRQWRQSPTIWNVNKPPQRIEYISQLKQLTLNFRVWHQQIRRLKSGHLIHSLKEISGFPEWGERGQNKWGNWWEMTTD